MSYTPRRSEKAMRRIIDTTYRLYPSLPRFSAGQEFDIPLHPSTFQSRGDCLSRGMIIGLMMDRIGLLEASQLSDIDKVRALAEGTGQCISCGRGFSWRMNPASEEMNVTFAARANQFFRT